MAGKDDVAKPQTPAPSRPTMPENRVVKGDDPRPGGIKATDAIRRKP